MLFRNKENPGSGFTDIHCHILPGIDDGAATLEESLQMLRLAAAGGTARVIATPHADVGTASNYDILNGLVFELSSRAKDQGIACTVSLGAEYKLDWELAEAASSKQIVTLAGTDHILVELPFSQLPEAVWSILYQLESEGYTPVIAHPERCAAVQQDQAVADRLASQGYLLQVNSGSLLGLNGSSIQRAALRMIKTNRVHFVASDAHSPRSRTPDLQKAYGFLARKFGGGKAMSLMGGNLKGRAKT